MGLQAEAEYLAEQARAAAEEAAEEKAEAEAQQAARQKRRRAVVVDSDEDDEEEEEEEEEADEIEDDEEDGGKDNDAKRQRTSQPSAAAEDKAEAKQQEKQQEKPQEVEEEENDADDDDEDEEDEDEEEDDSRSQEERDADSALLAPWIVKLESYGEEAAPFLGGRQPDEMVKTLTIPTKHLFIRRVAGRARGRQVTAEAGQSREAAARAGSGRGAASSSRLIACCGCVSQLEELMLLEVSELEAGRDSMAEMIGQVNKVVSGWRASLSLSLCPLPSLCPSPVCPSPVPSSPVPSSLSALCSLLSALLSLSAICTPSRSVLISCRSPPRSLGLLTRRPVVLRRARR